LRNKDEISHIKEQAETLLNPYPAKIDTENPVIART
jgi:hypothetical protein